MKPIPIPGFNLPNMATPTYSDDKLSSELMNAIGYGSQGGLGLLSPEDEDENDFFLFILSMAYPEIYEYDEEYYSPYEFAISPAMISMMGGLAKLKNMFGKFKSFFGGKKKKKKAKNPQLTQVPPEQQVIPAPAVSGKMTQLYNWIWRLENQLKSYGLTPVKEEETTFFETVEKLSIPCKHEVPQQQEPELERTEGPRERQEEEEPEVENDLESRDSFSNIVF